RTPARARPCTIARPAMARGSVRLLGLRRLARAASAELRFERGHLRLQGLELLARAQQDRLLHVEFLARDQVQPRQAGLQHGLEVLLQLFAAFAQAGGHEAAEAAREVVDVSEVDHGEALLWCLQRGAGA